MKQFPLSKQALLLLLSVYLSLPLMAERRCCDTIAIFAINDFHGAFVRDNNQGVPGAASILETIDSLKSVYPHHVVVASGDNFGGSYFNQTTNGILMPYFFEALGIRISALGNHEFDYGQAYLAKKWANTQLCPTDWTLRYVCANVRDESGHVPTFVEPFVTQRVTLPDGHSVNIGFIGLITSATPWQASASKLKGLSFDGRYNAVLDSLQALSSYAPMAAADIRVLLTHIGTTQANSRPVWEDRDAAALKRIKSKKLHGIFTAHTHQKVCGRINKQKYAVVQGGWHGNHISILKIAYNTLKRRIVSVEPELCPVRPAATLSPKSQHLQTLVDSLLLHTKTPGGTPIGEVLTTLPRPISHSRAQLLQQTEMGTLVCSSYAEAVRAGLELSENDVVIGVSHFGSIRAGFNKGSIRVLDVGEALPFSNAIKVYKITGSELLRLFKFGLNHTRLGIMQSANAEVIRDQDGAIESLVYISPKGHRLPLIADGVYYLAADEYMTLGGDGYAKDLFPADREVKADSLPNTTDAFITFLKNHHF
ncbi:MAG: bifunctional metallophosphatase/5'-nucleotidase [Bacteroidaceae bacterium]|nr:bifunctional metallophosphatase/5'-nucleotidase [Bacteroidaceae bacterium]